MSTFERAQVRMTEYEFRTTGAGLPRFYGYAAVFNSDSEPLPVLNGAIETLMPGAFVRSLKTDRNNAFDIDHDPNRVLSSRRSGRLVLAEDSRGLIVESDLPDTSYARDLVVLHDAKEVRGMSFTFNPTKDGQQWSPDRKRRTLTEVKLGDVTVVTAGYTPAYRTTTASIRSLADALGAEAEELEDAIGAIRDGSRMSPRAVDLLQSVIAELREQPVSEPAAAGVQSTVREWQLALAAKKAS